MAIDIKGITGTTPAPRRVDRSSGGGSGAASSRPAGSGEQVSITDTAASLENVARLMAQIPVVDAGRVETIRDALSRGSYQIDPDSTAEKFIQFELMLNRAVMKNADT